MMAWQAHFEEIGGLWNKSMEHFVARLANSRQVPTFSLIRRMIQWGQRVPGLVYVPWAVDAGNAVRGQPDGPAFFSGQWITLSDGGELGFPAGDRYVEYHATSPGQSRIYPAPVPGGGLALGTPDGRIELFSPSLREGRISLTRRGPLTLADGTVLRVPGAAAPTFGSARGRRLLVIADEGGELHVYVGERVGLDRERAVHPRRAGFASSGGLDRLGNTRSHDRDRRWGGGCLRRLRGGRNGEKEEALSDGECASCAVACNVQADKACSLRGPARTALGLGGRRGGNASKSGLHDGRAHWAFPSAGRGAGAHRRRRARSPDHRRFDRRSSSRHRRSRGAGNRRSPGDDVTLAQEPYPVQPPPVPPPGLVPRGSIGRALHATGRASPLSGCPGTAWERTSTAGGSPGMRRRSASCCSEHPGCASTSDGSRLARAALLIPTSSTPCRFRFSCGARRPPPISSSTRPSCPTATRARWSSWLARGSPPRSSCTPSTGARDQARWTPTAGSAPWRSSGVDTGASS